MRLTSTVAALVCVSAVFGQFSEMLTPDLSDAAANQWQFVQGDWRFGDGTLVQTEIQRTSAALLREPAFGDLSLTVDFHIAAEGPGVRAAAIIFRATGTHTYYWLHMDSKNRQFILVRSEPGNGWIEIARVRFRS